MRGIETNGEQIKALRREHGLTQEALASRAGVDARTIRNAERGSRVDAETLKCLASALKVQASDLARPQEQSEGHIARVAIQQWEDAFFATDADRLVAHYREDAVMQLPSSPHIEGTQAIRAAFEAAFESFRFERVTESSLNFVGERVFLESGKVRMASRSDGSSTEAIAVHIFVVESAVITEHVGFYDVLQFVS
ncbi:MAG: helix-turn-helix domain-containing protein [Planctomycetota bacterium]